MKTNKLHNEKPITSQSFEVGKILKMDITKNEGLIIKDNYQSRLKFFVVIGQKINEGIVGVFLINSKINPKALADYQFPLNMKDYSDVLIYDSYLDCSDIFVLDKVKIYNNGLEIGKLTEKDLKLVIYTIERSEILTPIEKSDYGFKDKSN